MKARVTSVRLPENLEKEVRAMAEAEMRTISNMIIVLLTEAVRERGMI